LGSVGILLGFNWNPIEGLLKSYWNHMGMPMDFIGSLFEAYWVPWELYWNSNGVPFDSIRTRIGILVESCWNLLGESIGFRWNSFRIQLEPY